ncbi:polyphosphate polymerase domain-containing protein [Cellulomonas composti]|uniref:VTC domain-containing protein n=1 Tax=Cellulomonas composti TaxID=266130 RepID=A0A511JCU9_9CELL|nr:polyphosphate polymerase domain-containing protein [Cellulomonas composti]GEL95802.1 VTC domain-containing protein [Cellulomonas composti]
MTALKDRLATLPTVDLDELEAAGAALQTRVDRKYVLPTAALDTLPLTVGARVLEIAGRRTSEYESVYFDTPDLVSYLGAAHRRRGRFKVRTRTYADSGDCFVEVKTRGARGATVKTRQAHDGDAAELTSAAHEFTVEALGAHRAPAALQPTLATRYQRSTLLVDGGRPGLVARTTIDTDLVWVDMATGEQRAMGPLVVIETKTGATPSATDRLLWRHGHRPVRISKYGTGMAVLHPDLPLTPWRRVLDRHVQPTARLSAYA